MPKGLFGAIYRLPDYFVNYYMKRLVGIGDPWLMRLEWPAELCP